jgi:tetratricopeptide (TPR) repeat protein
LCSLPLLVSLGLPGVARADGDADRQAAQALFDSADELMKRKDYAAACPKLEEVTRLIPDGLGAKLTLAECYEGAGKLASAWSTYSQVESLAARQNQPDRQTLARDRAAQLKPKLAKLVINVPAAVSALPGLAINATASQSGLRNSASSRRRRHHTIEASATGKLSWSAGGAADSAPSPSRCSR